MLKIASSKKGFTLVEIMIVVAIIGILVSIAVPGFINARKEGRAKACQESQEKMDGAVSEWSLQTGAAEGDTPGIGALVGANLYLGKTPMCPIGPAAIDVPANDAVAVCPNSETSHVRP